MPRTIPVLFPPMIKQLAALGERLRLARLRRQMSAGTLAARAGIARGTLGRAERGDPAVSLAIYAMVLRVVGLHHDLDSIARDDVLGRKLQDLKLPVRKRAPRKRLTSPSS